MEGAGFNRGDVVSGSVLAALGVFIIIESRHWEYLGADGPGPGFFPLWYGIAMVALSLLLVGGSVLRPATGESAKGINWKEVGHALATWGVFAGCIALLKVLGFLLSFGLFTLFVVAVMYRRPLPTALAVAVGSALGFYLLFPLALNVALPVGILGF